MNGEAFTILIPRSFFGIFLDYGSLNTQKSVSLTNSDVQTFLEGDENQNTERKIASYVISSFGNGRVPERFLWSVSTKSITKNFVCRKLRPLFVFVVFQRIFHLEPQRQRTLRFLFGDCRSFYFHLLVK